MKKIKLREYTRRDPSHFLTEYKKHRVYLGNGFIFLFSNRKDLLKFLAECSRFLTGKFFELNEINIEVRTIYQRNWFYLNGEERLINQMFDGIDNKYGRIHSQYKDYYVIIDFTKIVNYLTSILEIIIELHRRRNNWAEIQFCNSIINRLRYLNYQIQSYGHNSKFRQLGKQGIKNL